MKISFKAICDDAFVTAGSNNLNIIGIFEHINSKSYPATHPRMSIVLSLVDCKPGQEISYYPIIEGPSGIILDGSKNPSLAKGVSNDKINLIFNVIGLNLPEPGRYLVKLFIEDLEKPETLEFEARLIN